MRTHLTRDGYDVAVANGGSAGLEAVRTTTPDVIVLDLRMQPVSGLEVLDALRASPATSDLPVLVVSVLEMAEEALKSGADAFLLKPFEPDTFIDAVHSIAKS
jgi:CheY-like chemotaxis protein